jgi:hypothetical protein
MLTYADVCVQLQNVVLRVEELQEKEEEEGEGEGEGEGEEVRGRGTGLRLL